LYKRKVLEQFREDLIKEIEKMENNHEDLNVYLLKLNKINLALQVLSDQYGWVVF
jgi:hypothetical protein